MVTNDLAARLILDQYFDIKYVALRNEEIRTAEEARLAEM